MDQPIAHADDVRPGDIVQLGTGGRADLVGRFTDQRNESHQRVRERVVLVLQVVATSTGGEPHGLASGVEHVLKASPVVWVDHARGLAELNGLLGDLLPEVATQILGRPEIDLEADQVAQLPLHAGHVEEGHSSRRLELD